MTTSSPLVTIPSPTCSLTNKIHNIDFGVVEKSFCKGFLSNTLFEKKPFCLDSETRTHSSNSQSSNATIKHHIQKLYYAESWERTPYGNFHDLLITSEPHCRCAIEAFCSRYEARTRMGRLKICYPVPVRWTDQVARKESPRPTDHLGEFDRARTCVNKCHKLAPKPLGHKLHISCFSWIRTNTSRTEIWYATITP